MISERQLRNLPGNIETNPKKHVNVVSLKSGKELGIEEKQVEEKAVEKNKEKEKDDEPNWLVKEYKLKIPYLTKVKKGCMDKQFGKFLELFKQLQY